MIWFIDTSKTVLLPRKRVVRVILSDGTSFRSAEVHMPLDANPEAYVSSLSTQDLWNNGQAIVPGSFFAAIERNYREYYWAVMQVMKETEMAGGTLADVLAGAMLVISSVPAKALEFSNWLDMAQISETPANIQEQKELLFAIIHFVNTGLTATL